MVISKFFAALKAPLKNVRWSWGAVRPYDGKVFLRVWDDRTMELNGHSYVQLTHLEKYGYKPGAKNLGYAERLRHVQMIRGGANSYLIICVPTIPHGTPRKIRGFSEDFLHEGGNLINHDGDYWIEIGKRVSVASVI